VAPVGFAAIIVAAQFTTLLDATAELTTPLVLFLTVLGFGLTPRRRWGTIEWWALIGAIAVFAVYGAPIVLSGAATFAGYLKLDDTATWLALTDRVMEHGRNLGGLAPSTYEATLAFNLADGYPVGVFLPLGVGHELVGEDLAWLIQPYMAVMAAFLALSLWTLAGKVLESRPLRAVAAFVGAQAALLYGYAMWGGIKEVAGAALIASLAAVLAWTLDPQLLTTGRQRVAKTAQRGDLRRFVPPAIVAAALLGVLSVGGAVWLLPLLIPAAIALVRAVGRRALPGMVAFASVVTLLSLPLVSGGRLLPPTSSPLTSATAKGNLIEPLDTLQVFGIWPSGDFRLRPDDLASARVLIAVVVIAAAVGLWIAWRRRAWGVLFYASAALGGALVLKVIGSPWVEGKGLATASPAFLFVAAAGAAALLSGARRVEGGILLAALLVGVAWSNVLAFHDVNLAPKAQLRELERIGEQIKGEGPTLMTEYQPYGARHFLRDADPESLSELRRRRIPLRSGALVEKGFTADLDELQLGGVLAYRTIVLRRSPAQSRPPSPYQLVSSGDFYDVWQRPASGNAAILEHLPLGNRTDASAVPSCAEVTRLAARAGPGGTLIGAIGGDRTTSVPLTDAEHPASWEGEAGETSLTPDGAGTVRARFAVPQEGEYTLWLGGSVRGLLSASVDGTRVGSIRDQLNNFGQYLELGNAQLGSGEHIAELDYRGPDLHPGSGGRSFPLGPLVVAAPTDPSQTAAVPAADAHSMCGRRWDWIEALR
jgi:hypothetical protein